MCQCDTDAPAQKEDERKYQLPEITYMQTIQLWWLLCAFVH